MAHFAELSSDSHVLRVVVLDNEILNDADQEIEFRGVDFLTWLVGGTWIQTSYNANFRGKFAGIGDLYSAEFDIFAPSQPFPSWTLTQDGAWSPPKSRPTGEGWMWDEPDLTWLLNINQADAPALEIFEGIGPTLSSRIISERENGGLFTSLEDLAARVDGIGTTTTETWTIAYAGQ